MRMSKTRFYEVWCRWGTDESYRVTDTEWTRAEALAEIKRLAAEPTEEGGPRRMFFLVAVTEKREVVSL